MKQLMIISYRVTLGSQTWNHFELTVENFSKNILRNFTIY